MGKNSLKPLLQAELQKMQFRKRPLKKALKPLLQAELQKMQLIYIKTLKT